jgi:hypothetical protein
MHAAGSTVANGNSEILLSARGKILRGIFGRKDWEDLSILTGASEDEQVLLAEQCAGK